MQWWERLPPTNVSWVRFPDPASYVGWVCCWFSIPLWEVFLRVPRLNQHFQIPIRSGCQALYHEPLARVIAQTLPVFDIKFAFTFTWKTISQPIYVRNVWFFLVLNLLQFEPNSFVAMAAYWVPGLPNIKGFSGHLWNSILIFANCASYSWWPASI